MAKMIFNEMFIKKHSKTPLFVLKRYKEGHKFSVKLAFCALILTILIFKSQKNSSLENEENSYSTYFTILPTFFSSKGCN